MFFGIVDDVVDKSDDNEESDSENETDNEDAEKELCAEVRHSTVYSVVNQFNLHPLCNSFATNILRFFLSLIQIRLQSMRNHWYVSVACYQMPFCHLE